MLQIVHAARWFRLVIPLTAALGLAACAKTIKGNDRTTASREGGVQVFLEAAQQLSGSAEWVPLGPEDTLHSGDRYRLAVHSPVPAYLYVGRTVSDGPFELLYPSHGASSEPPKTVQSVVLPDAGKGYVLDQKSGEESIFALAAEHPLSADEIKTHAGAAAAAEPGASRERPPTLSGDNRGNGDLYTGKPIAPGLKGLRFTFHRGR